MVDFNEIQRAIPFFGLMAQDQRARPYLTRLLEQSAVGILVSAVGLYTNDKMQDQEVKYLRERIIVIEMDRVLRKQELDRDLRGIKMELRDEFNRWNTKLDRLIELKVKRQ